MSNIIPPLLSSSPPPIVGPLDEEDDEFGDFTTGYNCDDLSLSPSPQKLSVEDSLDINRNKNLQEKQNSSIVNCTNIKETQLINGSNCDTTYLDESPDNIGDFNCFDNKEVTTKENYSNQSENTPPIVDKEETLEQTNSITTNGHFEDNVVDSLKTKRNSSQEETSQFCTSDNSEELIVDENLEEKTDCGQKVDNKLNKETENETESYENYENEHQKISELENPEDPVMNDQFDDFAEFQNATGNLNFVQNNIENSNEFSCKFQEENKNFDEEKAKKNNLIEENGDSVLLSSNSDLVQTQPEDVIQQIDDAVICENDFAPFSTVSEKPSNKCEATDNSSKEFEFDDFTSFASFGEENTAKTQIETEDTVMKTFKLEDNEDEFTDFADFSKNLNSDLNKKDLHDNNELNDNYDNDDDFGDFTSTFTEEKNEFGDFGQNSTSKEKTSSVLLQIDSKDIFEKTETIVKEFFDLNNEDQNEDYLPTDLKNNFIFDQLKDVTETNALTYQWSKSSSQKVFLKSLNIDMRNILYGPAWNNSMSTILNLGTPLEPTKTDILTPTPVTSSASPSNSSQKSNEIPSVQFDWSDSDLVNPLESQSVENLERLEDPSQIIMDKIIQLSIEKSKSEQPTTTLNNDIVNDFSSFPSSGMIPLRETHISNDPSDFSTWLEPTIVTPELPRKMTSSDNDQEKDDDFDEFQMVLPEPKNETREDVASSMIPNANNDENVVDDEEFTDFYSSLPPPNAQPVMLKPAENIEPSDFLKPTKSSTVSLISNDVFHTMNNQLNAESTIPANLNVPSLSMPKVPSSIFDPLESNIFKTSEPIPIIPQKNISKSVYEPLETLHSTKIEPVEPIKPSNIPKPNELKKLEPMDILKPSVQPLQPVPVEHPKPQSTHINWPDPGVTDDDIKHIELSYSRKQDDNNSKSKSVKKENSLDDEEWSDFVSVQHPATNERTSTPDLPLSVLNLNQLQPARQPIPVITPSGLLQTKLSTNQPKVVQTTLQQNFYKPQPVQPQQYQPSIISQTFTSTMQQPNNYNQLPRSQTNFNEFTSSNFYRHQDQVTNIAHSIRPQSQFQQSSSIISNNFASSTNPADDDDDWSDFVSSQPIPQTNGFKNKTNIITNPQFETFVTQKKVQKQIPSISAMPDLDFIAPKNRTKK